MHKISFILIFVFPSLAFGQPQVKQPPSYFVFLHERGELSNDGPVGVWSYYDSLDQPSIQLNYNDGKLIYTKKDTTDFIARIPGGLWTTMKLSVPCRPLASYYTYWKHFQTEFNIFRRDKLGYYIRNNLLDTGRLKLRFSINHAGIISTPEITYNNLGKIFGQFLLETFSKAPNIWIAAKSLSGNSVECLFNIEIFVCEKGCDSLPDRSVEKGKNLFRLYHSIKPVDEKEILSYAPPPLTNFSGFLWGKDDSGFAYIRGNGHYTMCDLMKADGTLIQNFVFPPVNSIKWLSAEQRFLFSSVDPFEKSYQIEYGPTAEDFQIIGSEMHYMLPSPDNKKIAWSKKFKKNEHLYIYDRLTKMNFLVPDQNPERKNRPAKWTDDSSMLFYVAVDDENVSRIIKYDLEKQESKQTIFLNAELCDISRDKSRILVNKRNLNYLPQFHILHLENDSIEKLNPKNINLLGGLFGQDHHYIYYLITDDLYLNNLYEKKSIRLVKNINGFGLSNDRKKIAYVDKNGIIYTMDWEGKNQRMIRALH